MTRRTEAVRTGAEGWICAPLAGVGSNCQAPPGIGKSTVVAGLTRVGMDCGGRSTRAGAALPFTARGPVLWVD